MAAVPFLSRTGKSPWQENMRGLAFENKDKDGIRIAQDGIIEWTGFLQGLVHNLFNENEKVYTSVQKRRRYLDSDLSECSDPEYWQELHHGKSRFLRAKPFG